MVTTTIYVYLECDKILFDYTSVFLPVHMTKATLPYFEKLPAYMYRVL